MKAMICVCLIAGVAAVALARPGEQYTDKYDYINVKGDILPNEKLFNNYYNCIMETGKCTQEGNELKSHIPEALEDGCAKCSEKQRAVVKEVIEHLIKYKVDKWNALKAKYDPDNKYSHKYEDEFKKLQKD